MSVLPRRTTRDRGRRRLPRVLPGRPDRVGSAVAVFRPQPDPPVGGGDAVNDQNEQRGAMAGCVSGCLGLLSFVVLFLTIIGALTVAEWVF